MSIKKNFFAPWALGLGATRRAAMLLLVMMLTTATAWADNINVETAAGFGTLTDGKYTLVNGNTYTLTGNINTDGYIYVPEGVTATIDLAGHTIDRGLTSADNNGTVIIVAGTLTITDSGTDGKIQGGYDGYAEHGFYVSGVEVQNGATFNLQGGTLVGRNQDYDYTVAVYDNGSFTMTGGKITEGWTGVQAGGNVTLTGGEISGNSNSGVLVDKNFSISGNPVITGNTNSNVYLAARGTTINITGALTEGANIGITAPRPTDNSPVTVTSGYGTYNSEPVSTYFSLDNNGQIQISPYDYMTVVMGWNEDKTEIAVGTALYTVNFDMNGHGDAIDAVSLLSGYKVAEPTELTADGWYFFGWYTDDACTSQWNFNNAVTSNMTLHALWAQEAIYSFTLPEKMVIVSTTNAPVGGKYPVGTVIKFKVSSADYVVDGDVSDGPNTLTPDGDGIYTVTMGETDITITATIKKAVEPNKTLSGSESYTANDGDVLTGSTSGTVTIAADAKITLSDVTITGGIVCAGTAEITLVGTNSVTGASNKAGIQVGESGSTTLTIKGNGSLTANGGNQSAGIGLSRAWEEDATGGDIIIEGGNITANGSVNGQWGAGIGTGVIYGNGSAKTAQIGNITIKGGTVKATGGSEADGIGTGFTYYGCTNTIGTVTIYDGIDKVDASSIKNSGSIVYKHEENDVTASKSDYFTIIEDGNRRVIEPKDDTDYTITIANGIEHGTLTGAATAKYTEEVTITATPALGYRFSRLVVKDAQNNAVASTGNSFFMPKSNVTVSAVFEQGTHGTTEFAWGYYGLEPGYVTEATIYDGVTTVNLQQGKKYFIGKDYQEGPEPGKGFYANEFRPDEDPYAGGRYIPYSGGTGSFMMGGYGEFTLNGDAGFYDITMTDVGNGKWNVSILKTAGQMDVVPDQTYIGSAITPEPLVIAGSLNLTKGTDYVYSYTNNTNVGTAKVRATFQGDYASLGHVEKEFKIVKATPAVNAPTAVADLVYKGSAQALVNAGSTDFGTLLYSLDGETYSEDIPTGTDAGTYTVYYKVEGSDNWNAVAAQTIEVTITYFDASLAAIVDNSDVISNIITNYDSKADMTLSDRTLYKDGNWNTLCLPFSLSAAQIAANANFAGATLMTMDVTEKNGFDVEDGTLYLWFKTATEIEAGVPYLVKWEKAADYEGNEANYDISNPVFEGVTVSSTAAQAVESTTAGLESVQMVGCYSPVSVTADDKSILFLGDANTLYYSTVDRQIRSCRAYFSVPYINGHAEAKARAFALSFDGEETTGILEVSANYNGVKDDIWYSLDGVRLSGKPTQRGMYINKGKKILVK